MAIPTGCVGYWDFENDLTDNSGKNHTLTSGGAGNTYDAAKIKSNSRKYNGTAADTCAHHTDFDFGNGTFVVALWIKDVAQNKSWIVNSDGYVTANGWACRYNNSNQVVFSDSSGDLFSYAINLKDGAWHRVVFVREGTGANQLKLYIDGNYKAQATSSVNLNANVTLRMGGHADAALFTGELDQVIFIKGATWDSTAVTADYNGGNGVDYNTATVNINRSALLSLGLG